jgi:hypothetical protein
MRINYLKDTRCWSRPRAVDGTALPHRPLPDIQSIAVSRAKVPLAGAETCSQGEAFERRRCRRLTPRLLENSVSWRPLNEVMAE